MLQIAVCDDNIDELSNMVFVKVIGRNVLYHLRSGKAREIKQQYLDYQMEGE